MATAARVSRLWPLQALRTWSRLSYPRPQRPTSINRQAVRNPLKHNIMPTRSSSISRTSDHLDNKSCQPAQQVVSFWLMTKREVHKSNRSIVCRPCSRLSALAMPLYRIVYSKWLIRHTKLILSCLWTRVPTSKSLSSLHVSETCSSYQAAQNHRNRKLLKGTKSTQ